MIPLVKRHHHLCQGIKDDDRIKLLEGEIGTLKNQIDTLKRDTVYQQILASHKQATDKLADLEAKKCTKSCC